MRENRLYSSEGGEINLPYPYASYLQYYIK